MSDQIAVKVDTEPKPGWKTTEFWLSLVVIIIGALLSSGLLEGTGKWQQIVGAIASVLTALGYTWTRGRVKGGGG